MRYPRTPVLQLDFTTEDFDMKDLPGMQYNSVGYDGNDGCIFVNGTNCYGSPRVTYEINDIVGAGIDYVSNEFFFTKNGEVVGKVGKEFDCPLFPTVGLYDEIMEVKVNFGHKPFTYDIEAIYPCSCCQCLVNDDSESATTTDDDSKPSVGNEECWKKLMEKSETLLRKSIEEKEKELAKLKAVLNALSDNFQ
ncbi:Ran-binding protein M homolog, partial [Linum perenne]